jgi:hypothetical protein
LERPLLALPGADVSDKGPIWRKPYAPTGGIPRDRDVRVEKHAVPEETWDEPATGRVDLTAGELANIRARRPTPERISRLEVKHDALALTVAKMDGKIDALLDLGAKAEQERQARHAADIAAEERRRKHTIALIGAIGTAIAGIAAAVVMS